MYYKSAIEEKKIPTILALSLLILMIGGLSSFLGKRSQNVLTDAKQLPIKRTEIANCSPFSCSVMAETRERVKMWIIYGEKSDRLNLSVSDARDLEKDKKMRFNHYFDIKNLKENTEYYCRFITDTGVSRQTCNFTTTPQFTTLAGNLAPAIGKVVSKGANPVKAAIVILKVEGANSLSTLTGETGGWVIPYYPLTKKGSFQLLLPQPDSTVNIEILGDEGEKSVITGAFKNINKLESKTIILGQNYTIVDEQSNVLAAFTTPFPKSPNIEILIPKEGALIPGNHPLFKGTALPGRKVQLTINPVKNTSRAKINLRPLTTYSDKRGVWMFSLTTDLQDGNYMMNLATNNKDGNQIQLKRNFVILKSGETVLGEATPEATLTPVATPTAGIVLTQVVTPTLTSTPEATITTVVFTTPTPPESGLSIMPLAITSLALIVIGTGLILIF